MVSWWEGREYPVEVQAGDVLFIAGRLPLDRTQKLPFEHVVIAAQNETINNPEDFKNLPVYGMPESEAEAAGYLTGISLNTGRYWLLRPWLGRKMGSRETVWNLASRESSVNASTAREIAYLLAQRAGSFPCRYGSVFRVDSSLSEEIQTNCLGFVCSVLEYFDLHIISHEFPIYPGPYSYPNEDARDFPSPGHLAHALNMNPTAFPWCAKDSSEADKYARVDVTFNEVVGAGSGSCAI
jgi:hypothetical protein